MASLLERTLGAVRKETGSGEGNRRVSGGGQTRGSPYAVRVLVSISRVKDCCTQVASRGARPCLSRGTVVGDVWAALRRVSQPDVRRADLFFDSRSVLGTTAGSTTSSMRITSHAAKALAGPHRATRQLQQETPRPAQAPS